MVTYLSIIDRLLRGLEVPVLLVGSGRGGRVYNGLPLWPRGHSKFASAAAGVLCRGGVPFMVLVCQEGDGLRWCC